MTFYKMINNLIDTQGAQGVDQNVIGMVELETELGSGFGKELPDELHRERGVEVKIETTY